MDKAAAVRGFFAERPDTLVLLSGGVDSAVLALLAGEAAHRVRALTFRTPLVSGDELETAAAVAAHLGLRHSVADADVTTDRRVTANGPDRCYWCRKKLHAKAWEEARRLGCSTVAGGVQADEIAEGRPGVRAAAEDGISHPLAEAGLTKKEIRSLARAAGLPNADRPPAPCLATRFPPGVSMDPHWTGRIGEAERLLRGEGLRAFRVRWFPPGAAILEVAPREMPLVWERKGRIVTLLREVGFPVVSLDLEGLQRGKMERFAEVPDHDPR
ncbi:MAG: ATP-dependent sacrificial sulfur transferase LarE [Synergistales bacterium]|nr:ATP-dependent sacrificial sulfur transferase LarE [Synergistales bacterium]